MITIFVLLFLCYFFLYLSSLFTKDNSYIDILWGISFFIITLIGFLYLEKITLLHTVTFICVFLWSLRISTYITIKKIGHSGEDPRYVEFRNNSKNFLVKSFFTIYFLQYSLCLIISIPLFIIFFADVSGQNIFITLLGSCIAIVGLVYETIADTQLKKFMKTKKKGQILQSGLRKFHRYPQYFGEAVFWLGISVLGAQGHFLSFIGVGTIFFLLRFVSGVPLLEKRYKNNAAYKKYGTNVPKFFPKYF